MSDSHEWCQDVPRDEAVRAAEDAAAVPAIMHRDLPDEVALLRASVTDILGRVVRIEGELDAGQAEEAAPPQPDPASPAEGFRTERVTLEVTQRDESYTPLSEFDWDAMLRSASRVRLFDGESVRVVEQTETMRCMTKLRRERDAARAECERLRDRVAELVRERDAAEEECEDLRRKKNHNDRVLWAKVDRAEARLEAVTAANAGGPEPSGASGGHRLFLALPITHIETEWNKGWARRVTREGTVKDLLDTWNIDDPDEQAAIAQVLRHLRDATTALHPPMKAADDEIVRLTAERDAARAEVERLRARVAELEAASAQAANAGGAANQQEPVAWGVRRSDGTWWRDCRATRGEMLSVVTGGGDANNVVSPLYAGPPRGWLTAEERGALERAFDLLCDDDGDQPLAGTVQRLLARSSPPRVKVPHLDDLEEAERPVWESACKAWIAAIRDAGGEVQDG